MSTDSKSPRGRKRAAAADVIDVQVNEAAVAEAGQAAVVVGQRSREIAERFGDGTPYDRERLLGLSRVHLTNHLISRIELGKCLVQIKENETFEDFKRIVEQQLGLQARYARKLMQAAVKFVASPLARRLAPLQQLGITKMIDLADEDDDSLVELAEGGTLAGAKLDEIVTMSVRELRTALLEARKDKAAKDKLIKDKNDKIDKLSEELHRRASSEPAEREAAQLKLLRADTLAAESALLRLLATVDTVTQDAATESADLAARQSLDFLVQKVAEGCLSRGINVDLAERVRPIWADAPKAKAA